MKGQISFSSDDGKISMEDLDETSGLTEKYFGTKNDPNQIQATPKNRDWIYENIPNYINVIKDNGKVIGYALMLPCTAKLMEKFLNKKINEAMLFENIKKIRLDQIPKTVYLCASIVREEFRRKGLATSAFVKMLNKINRDGENKPVLFCWEYSSNGGRLVRKIANILDLKLRVLK